MAHQSVIASLVSVKEAAAQAEVSYDTILNAIKSDQLKAVQPGGRKYLIMKRDLKKWIEEYKPQPVKTTPTLFVTDNSRNVEIRNQAADLMLEGNRLFEKAYNLLKEIA